MKNLMKEVMIAMVLTLIGLSAQAEIISTKTMKGVQAKIEDILKTQNAANVLVVFDIDMTLTQPDHPAVYYPAIKKYVDIYKKILGQLTPEQKDIAVTLTTQIVPQKWVEAETPQVIKNIQQRNMKVIALTSSLAGQLKGYKDKIIILRKDQLQKMGLDLSKNFKDFQDIMTFSDFKEYVRAHPMFYQGVLSANGEQNASKGEVLNAFLDLIGSESSYEPKVIIMIDDKKKHLIDVEAHLKSHDPSIQFIGIEYQGAYEIAPRDISKEGFQKFWEDLANQAKQEN